MNPKFKALLYNFIGFAIVFLCFRLLLGYLLPLTPIFLAFTSAIAATFLAPKFGVVGSSKKKKVLMKWIFIKGSREV